MREAGGSLAAEATFDLGTISSYHLTALPPSAPLLSSYYHSWQCRLVGHQVNVLTYAWFVHGACMRMHMHMHGRCMARYVGEHLHPPRFFRSAGCRCRYHLYLTHISPTSHLYLPYIFPISAECRCRQGVRLQIPTRRALGHAPAAPTRPHVRCRPGKLPCVMGAATPCDGGRNPM